MSFWKEDDEFGLEMVHYECPADIDMLEQDKYEKAAYHTLAENIKGKVVGTLREDKEENGTLFVRVMKKYKKI